MYPVTHIWTDSYINAIASHPVTNLVQWNLAKVEGSWVEVYWGDQGWNYWPVCMWPYTCSFPYLADSSSQWPHVVAMLCASYCYGIMLKSRLILKSKHIFIKDTSPISMLWPLVCVHSFVQQYSTLCTYTVTLLCACHCDVPWNEVERHDLH